MDSITDLTENLKKIEAVVQRSLASIKFQRDKIQKCINNLKINIETFMNSFKEGKKKMNDAIRKTLRKTSSD